MKCKYANRDVLERLLNGDMTESERDEYLTHLNSDCQDCEEFFASLSEDEVKTLFELANSFSDTSETNYQWQRFKEKNIDKRPFWSSLPLKTVSAAVFSILFVFLVFSIFLSHRDDGVRFKGNPSLGFYIEIGKMENGEALIDNKIEEKGEVEAGKIMLFSYRIYENGDLTLIYRSGSGDKETLLAMKGVPAGAGRLSENGKPIIFKTEGLVGSHRFILRFESRGRVEEKNIDIKFK